MHHLKVVVAPPQRHPSTVVTQMKHFQTLQTLNFLAVVKHRCYTVETLDIKCNQLISTGEMPINCSETPIMSPEISIIVTETRITVTFIPVYVYITLKMQH